MSENYSIERDLKEAEAMAKALAPYVYQDVLYGRVGSGGLLSAGSMPSLTLGALRMRMRRLGVLRDEMTEKQEARFQKVEHRNDQVFQEWRVHYEKKMIREAKSRLDAIQTFFSECRQSPSLCARVYKPEVLRRTIVEDIYLVLMELDQHDEELESKRRVTDSQLHGVVRPCDFIWSEILEPAYPRKQFWWLYHQPPTVD